MAKILAICKLSVGAGPGAKDYYFQGSTAYDGISAETGVTIIKDDDWNDDEPLIPVANLILAGKAQRLVVDYVTTGDLKASTTLLFSKDKVAAAEAATSSLKGKTYKVKGVNKGTIYRARGKRDRYNKY